MSVVELLSSLGSIALIVGIVIAVAQLWALRQQRHEELVIRAYEPFLDEGLTTAYWRIQRWGQRDYATFSATATVEDWTSLDIVATYFEMIGVLYKRGLAPLDLLDDLFAGSLLVTWAKVKPLVHGYRAEAGVPDYAQWFERLAGDLERRVARIEAKASAG